MTEFLTIDGGSLAYDVQGEGPLVVLAHGIGMDRSAFRFLEPQLVAAGYRVANLDLRGCGESSTGFSSYSRTEIAGDLLALVRHLGGPAVLIGHSIAGGAVTIAAAQAPELVASAVEIGPFTRKLQVRLSDLRDRDYRRGTMHLMGVALLGSARQWAKYLQLATPGVRPADWDAQLAGIAASLQEPGRMAVLKKMCTISPADAGEQLANVACPVLVLQGTDDPDWVSPRGEGEAVIAALPAGLGRLTMIEGAGHYPHVQYPAETAAALLPFLASTTATAQAAPRA